MQFIPVKTRVLQPPQDDLFAVLDEYLVEVQEQDVLIISSKVVAIGEGRCVPVEEFDKESHIKSEAQLIIPRSYWKTPLTMINNLFISSVGIDKSNSKDHYTLLPRDSFQSAEKIHQYLRDRFGIKDVGVIITDSRSQPARFGATGAAIGFWGVEPLVLHKGKKDLFGREIQIERSNIIDGIAAGANVVMGEVAESTPIVIAQNVPNITFAEGNFSEQLFCPLEEDTFRVLYQEWL